MRVFVKGALLLGVLVGCAGTERPTSPAETPSFTLSAGATTTVAARGANALIRLSIQRGGDYANAVVLSAVGLPAHVTPTFSAGTLILGTDSSTLVLEVDTDAVPGIYQFTVRANGTGPVSDSSRIELIVPTPSISINTVTSAITVTASWSPIRVDFALGRQNGFFGPITLSLEGATNDIDTSFDPATLSSGVLWSALYVSSSFTSRRTTTSLTVKASGVGVADKRTTFTVTTEGQTRLSTGTTTLTVAPGGRALMPVTLARYGGMGDNVELEITGMPAGITATFSPSVVTTYQTLTALTLTVDVNASVAPGTYSLSLRSTFPGSHIGSSNAGINVIVAAP